MTDEKKPTIIKRFPGQAVDAHLKEKGCLPGEICYTDMESNILLEALADDAAKWAAAFNQHARKLGYQGMDEGWLISWFANAIEHSSDVRRWRKEGAAVPSNPQHLQ